MKKTLILQIAASSSLLAIFYGCSGSSNNLPTNLLAGSVGVSNAGSLCGNSGSNSEVCSQSYDLTGDKRTQYLKYCGGRQATSQNVCKVSIKGGEQFSIDLPNEVDAINDAGLPILNPGSQNGGLPTGITVYPGDLLTVSMPDGHYSSSPSYGHCTNEVDVQGNQTDEDGDTSVLTNSANGMQAGAYLEFVDASGVRSGFQPIGHTAVRISVPTNGSQTNPLSVLVGYNTTALSCGDIKISYHIKRCMDVSLNTYDCSKL